MNKIVYVVCSFLLFFCTNAYCSTKITFKYEGGYVDAAHLSNVVSYWVIVNKEKVGTISISGGVINSNLKVGDKVAIGVNIKGSEDALLSPEYVVGNTTQEINAVAEPLVTAVLVTYPNLQAPIFMGVGSI